MTRESVADAALSIADRDGFDAVTIRAVAAEVGATPMALYTYFADKDALYEGMRERMFARVASRGSSRHAWQSMLEQVARGVFRTMREHPDWTPLLAHGSGPPGFALGFFDELLELMQEDGVSLEDAIRAYGCVMSFAIGSVLFEHLMTGGGDVIAKRLALLKELVARAPSRHANLASIAGKLDRWSFDDVFELGLRSLLIGIEAKRTTRSPRTKRAAANRI